MRLLVCGLVLVVLALLGGCGQRPDGSRATGPAPVPPAATRWVGSGQVVVAVPRWWSTGGTRCSAPVEDTVYYDHAATVDCSDAPSPSTVQEVSALAVLDADSGYGQVLVREMHPIGRIGGREVLERKGCEHWFVGVCRRIFAVPSEGVVFAVTIAGRGDGDYTSIRDSVRVLPATSTAGPVASHHEVRGLGPRHPTRTPRRRRRRRVRAA